MYLYTVDSKMYKIVRTLWTNKYADPDWSAINLYPEIPESPIFDNEIVYVSTEDFAELRQNPDY